MREKDNGYRTALLALNQDDKNELDELHKELIDSESVSSDSIVLDESLIKRVAAYCLYLLQRTPANMDSIRKVAYIISGFNRYEFADPDINDATELAIKLSEGWGEIEASIFDKWDEMKYLFDKV